MNSHFVYLPMWLAALLFVGHAEEGEFHFVEHAEEGDVQISQTTIQQLYDIVSESQAKEDYPSHTGQIKIKSKGTYKCELKVHAAGGPVETTLRWMVNFNDYNGFVAMWISMLLIDAHIYGKAPKPSEEQLISSIEFCSSIKVPNQPLNSSLKSFYPYYNNHFTLPTPLLDFLNFAKTPFSNIYANERTKDKIDVINGIEKIKELSTIVTGTTYLGKLIESTSDSFQNIYHDPDSDDTFSWIEFGSLLKMFGDEFPQSRDTWIGDNPNIQSAFDALKKYAYRPFSDDPRVNTIDPSSYYVVRHFLDQAKNDGKDLALITTWFATWLSSPPSGTEYMNNKLINDLDGTMSSNALTGITTAILSELVDPEVLEDPDLSLIYQSTSAHLAFLINSNFSDRLDLALPYNPPRYQFYWTVARTVSFMESYKKKQDFPVKVMEDVYNELKQAVEGEATRFVLANAKDNHDGSLYLDDFLGNGDVTEDNKLIVRGEDRIYTTATAANFLMYTWLSFDITSKESQWKANTPDSVKKFVKGCILWLTRNALEGRFKPWNAIFCAQNKGTSNVPFRYPANLILERPQSYWFQYQSHLQLFAGMTGYVPKTEYDAMINAGQFGKPTPTVFKGFNDPDFSTMLYWSSNPYTYAATLLALSRYREIKVSS